MPQIFFLMFFSVFFFVFGVIIFTVIRGIGQWNKNNNSPRLSVDAEIVAKRTACHRHHSNGHHHTTHSYYITFQFESGDRMELRVPSNEFGLLVEGDMGVLSFQGTRYLGFERN